ncbi:MAG: phosphatase PAP2 family protein [Flavobacteriales bacterium]|jgi:membrane-associated phospholipid phosphatase|nr:phosphatase PAP2 family protein [Flavobacteriales bacterium]|tara:strand:+ start:25272 stop:26129 length:858 start_codon:yes stop_codon:yes gene_type:complete
MLNTDKLDAVVNDNFKKVKLGLLFSPFCLLCLVTFYVIFFNTGEGYVDGYVNIQKDLFFYLNGKLSEFPNLQFNLTQLGDVLIFFPFLTVFIVYAPKIWEALLSSAILSLLVSAILKKIFAMPRPAAIFENESFVIIGKILSGNTSLPSGHSIATFVVITILLFAFMPKRNKYKVIWSSFILMLGFIIAFSRVGVGAHYPIDVIVGSIIGYIVTVIGIQISNKVDWFAWISNKRYYPVFILSLIIWGGVIVAKILGDNLPVFYFSLFSLIISLCLITSTYVQKRY